MHGGGCKLPRPDTGARRRSILGGFRVDDAAPMTASSASAPAACPSHPSGPVADVDAFDEGAPVVHLEHGVGRFEGLTRIETGADESEFLTLAYADDARLHVPVSSLHLVAPFAEPVPGAAPLDSLGAARWPNARKKAAEAVADVAARLLEARSRRAAARRDPHEIDREALERFVDGFAFEPTPDQRRASDAILADLLEAEVPMDRVVCGDVGFGKTELAMRAAFVAAAGGRQVAVLVPTTLLVAQHLAKFERRFAGTGLRIGALSRLDDAAVEAATVEAIGAGELDIVIGTHRLLGDDVVFPRLGLAVIDEEHRFGVQQKERVTAMRNAIDVLTLTATPIPRTLDAGLAGLRDVSVIQTPPDGRRAVDTTVAEADDALVREALERELGRDGQAFVLHNAVDSIEATVARIGALVPGARVRHGHGQMDEAALEAIMDAFRAREFDVLVATTIIENGLDVPNANTIVIESAEELGLAQLHQLRGRVGRSDRDAYALLLTGPEDALTDEARARLAALERFDRPGAGFDLARRDLEIRGAGELLGEEQSGRVADVGHALYAQLLAKAVRALENGAELDPDSHGQSAEIDVGAPALLPSGWIEDVAERLRVYVALAGAASPAALAEIGVELVERHGPLPAPASRLLDTHRLRLRCEALGIASLRIGAGGGQLAFADVTSVDRVALAERLAEAPEALELDEGSGLAIEREFDDTDAGVAFVDALLDDIEGVARAGAGG